VKILLEKGFSLKILTFSIKNEDSIFCNYCGAILKVDCPKCGEKETILTVSENICLREIEKLKKEKHEFIRSNLGWLRFDPLFLAMTITIIIIGLIVIVSLFFPQNPLFRLKPNFYVYIPFGVPFCLILLIVIISFPFNIIRQKRKDKVSKKFVKEFPIKDSLIKKAKSIGL